MRGAAIAAVLLTAASPGPAQVATQAPSDTLLVFFDWGKPELKGDAREALDALVASDRARLALTLTGHSDRSGASGVNRRAALRRAEAVRAYLAEKGIARERMTVATSGEERPIIATDDGVREAQNRRVEISFGPNPGN